MAENESRQPSNIAWVILAGALGVFAVSGRNSSTDDTPSTSNNASKETSKESGPRIVNGRHSLDPMDDFFSLESRQRRPFTDKIPDNYARDYLIVTVPDPIDSQFGYLFDELMDSIQRALEVGGYVIDRAWLPWELDKNNPIRTKIVTDWRQMSAVVFPFRGLKDEEAASYREDNPGTLLFRSTDTKQQAVRIVFLVGENPTSGIDKRALMRGIKLINDYPPDKDPLTIRIVGPVCSGSRESMQIVLHNQQCNECFTFEVISGGATGVKREALAPEGSNVQFHATVIPNNVVLQATLHYLYARNESHSNDTYPRNETGSDEYNPAFKKWLGSVAILAESNTGFGQRLIEQWRKNRPEIEGATSILELSFPLHMASLRSRYEEARRREEEKLNLPDTDSLVPRLSNKLPNQDSIPLQDAATTTSINGQVLQNILSIIRSRRIRYVGITASDVRDQIMLVSAIRDYCPAVQIFLIGCDRLLTQPEYSYYLKGTIIGSTYPLIPENQERTDPKRQRNPLIFPSQEAQGCFNAILAQTGGEESMIEYRPPLLRGVHDVEESRRRPPVWISMIGPNGDIVPLQFFTTPGTPEEQEYVWTTKKPTDPQEMHLSFPESSILPLVLLGVLCLLLVYYALRSPTPRLFWPSGQNYKDRGFWEDLFQRIVCLSSLIFLLVPLTELCWLKSSDIAWEGPAAFIEKTSLILLPVSILFFLVLALFTPLVRERLSGLETNQVRQHWVHWSVSGFLVLFAFGGIVYLWYRIYFVGGLDSWKALFFDRALNLTTGVSPLLPLALLSATFFFWAFFQLKKSHLAERFSIPCPYPADSDAAGAFQGIRDTDRKLRNEFRAATEFIVETPIAVFAAVALVLAVVAICVYRLSLLVVPTPEGRGWDRVFFLGFVLGYFLIALNLMRFLLLWKRLKKLLHEVALVRMMHAFERLPHKVVMVFGGYFSTRRPRLSQLRILHHQLGLLRIETDRLVKMASDPEVENDLPKLQLIKKELDKFSEDDFKSPPGEDAEEKIMGRLSNKFREMTEFLLRILPDCWSKHSFEDAFGSDAIGRKSGRGKERLDQDRPVSDSAGGGVGALQHWVQHAEEFIAMQVVIYLSQFFIQLRNLAWSIIICGSLLLLGATSYPFQPERLILYLLLALIGSSLAGILMVLVRINQDELVSRIMRTTPNKFQFDWAFASSFFTYIVPMGTVVALQMSGTFRFLLEPLVRLVR